MSSNGVQQMEIDLEKPHLSSVGAWFWAIQAGDLAHLLHVFSGDAFKQLPPATIKHFLPFLAHLYRNSLDKHPLLLFDSRMNRLEEYIESIYHDEKISILTHVVRDTLQTQDENSSQFKESISLTVFEEGGDVCERIFLVLREVMRIMILTSSKKHLSKDLIKSELLMSDAYFDDVVYVLSLCMLKENHLFDLKPFLLGILPQGKMVVYELIMNQAIDLYAVVDTVADLVKYNEYIRESDFFVGSAKDLLILLCDLSVHVASLIRLKLLDIQQFPAIILYITVDVLNDTVSFFPSMMSKPISNMQPCRMNQYAPTDNSWFWDYLKMTSNENSLEEEGRDLLSTARLVIMKQIEMISSDSGGRGDDTPKLISILRCFGALIGLASMVLRENEIKTLLSVIMNAGKSMVIPSRRFVAVSVCIVLLIGSTSDVLKNREILSALDSCVRSIYGTGHGCSVILLISLLLHTNQGASVITFLRCNLGCESICPSLDGLVKFGEVRRRVSVGQASMFRSANIGGKIISQAPIQGISSKCDDMYTKITLRCVYVLLCERSFLRQRVDPGNWLIAQMQQCTLPVHPLLPAMMMEYVECLIKSIEVSSQQQGLGQGQASGVSGGTGDFRFRAIPHSFVNAAISSVTYRKKCRDDENAAVDAESKGKWGPAVLFGLYALYYNERIQTCAWHYKHGGTEYDISIATYRHMIYHTSKASNYGEDFEFIHTHLINYFTKYYPEIVASTTYYALCDAKASTAWQGRLYSRFSTIMTKELHDSFTLLQMIDEMESLSPKQMVPFIDIFLEKAIPEWFQAGLHPTMTAVLKCLWTKTFWIHPSQEKLCIKVINLFLRMRQREAILLAYDDLLKEPFVVFNIPDQVFFSSPPLCGILLDTLQIILRDSAMKINRQANVKRLLTNPTKNERGGREKDGKAFALDPLDDATTNVILLQESIVFHCLVELINEGMGPDRNRGEEPEPELWQDTVVGALYSNDEKQMDAMMQTTRTRTTSTTKNMRCRRDSEATTTTGTSSQHPHHGHDFAEVCHLMLRFIDAMFSTHPILMKIVHSQEYPTRVLRMVVQRVPTIVHSFEYIFDMLLNTKVLLNLRFVLMYASLLAQTYPEHCPAALPKQIFSRCRDTILSWQLDKQQSLDASKIDWLSNVIPFLPRLCRCFPDVSPDFLSILLHLRDLKLDDNKPVRDLAMTAFKDFSKNA